MKENTIVFDKAIAYEIHCCVFKSGNEIPYGAAEHFQFERKLKNGKPEQIAFAGLAKQFVRKKFEHENGRQINFNSDESGRNQAKSN